MEHERIFTWQRLDDGVWRSVPGLTTTSREKASSLASVANACADGKVYRLARYSLAEVLALETPA